MLFTIYFLIFLNFSEIDSVDVYSVNYRLIRDNTVGTLVSRTSQIILNGKRVYYFSTEAKSNGMVSEFKPFHTTQESWAEIENLQTLHIKKYEDLHGNKKNVEIFLNQLDHQGIWNISANKEYSLTENILPNSRDLLTLFYLLKAIPTESLAIGKSWNINMVKEFPSVSDTVYSSTLPAIISRFEKKNLEGREIWCFVFEISYKDDFLGKTEKILIWLSEHKIEIIKRGSCVLILKQK
ncbi:MAG: DUF3108 domain-containing protein [Patescibacteria group bacterium]|nr:DUF3108 domain-containing protein [Patescibacteria group bacterium]